MQKSPSVFEPGQESKFQQLQREVSALEQQLEHVLKEQLELVDNHDSHLPIPLVYVSDRFAKSGIRLDSDMKSV